MADTQSALDTWLAPEEAIAMTMRIMGCSREEAIELLEEFRDEHPESVIYAHA